MGKIKARDLISHRPTNDIERARRNRDMQAIHGKALESEFRAQQRAKGITQ